MTCKLFIPISTASSVNDLAVDVPTAVWLVRIGWGWEEVLASQSADQVGDITRLLRNHFAEYFFLPIVATAESEVPVPIAKVV